MPRRKAFTNNNNAGEVEEPPRKRRVFYLDLPKRREILGNVLVCGNGETGQLGLGEDVYERKRLAIVENIPNAVDVCAGGMHCLVLTNEGEVYSFGCNDEGALGRDTSEDGSEALPGRVDLPKKVLCISAGDSHSACLLEDGSVYAWGSFRDSHGNMGLTNDGNRRTPIDLMAGVECSSIASGADHLVILTRGGKVYTVGCAEQGQLGRISERSISGEGRRGKRDLLRPDLVNLKRVKPIEAIWATNYCTFMRESQTSTIWAVGLNNYKQLLHDDNLDRILIPIKTTLENVKQIAGGQHHTLVLKTDNKCYAAGRPEYGRLGLGDLKDVVSEITPIKSFANQDIELVACGEACSYAITSDGKLYSWGMGSNNQLGVGDGDDELEPVLVQSKNTTNKRILIASGGGQHGIFLSESEIVAKAQDDDKEKGQKIKNDNDLNAQNDKKKETKAAPKRKEAETKTEKKEKENKPELPNSDSKEEANTNASDAADIITEPPAKRGRKKK